MPGWLSRQPTGWPCLRLVVAAMSGKPTLIAKNPLCPPERHVELANELMEEWEITGVVARLTFSGAHIEPDSEEDEIF